MSYYWLESERLKQRKVILYNYQIIIIITNWDIPPKNWKQEFGHVSWCHGLVRN